MAQLNDLLVLGKTRLVGDVAFFNELQLNGPTLLSNHLYLTGAVTNSSTSNTSQIVFGTPTDNHVAISSNTDALVINKDTATSSPQIVLYINKQSSFPNGISCGPLTVNGNTAVTGTISATSNISSGGNVIVGTKSATNPYYKLADSNENEWYFQALNNKCYIGPTSAKALNIDIDGNICAVGSISIGRKADTDMGDISVAIGYNVTASGNYSHAEGNTTVAAGAHSHAEGYGGPQGSALITTGTNTTQYLLTNIVNATITTNSVIQYNDKLAKVQTCIEGADGAFVINVDYALSNDQLREQEVFIYNYGALGNNSHSEGYHTTASGISSHAEGRTTTASGISSHAEGRTTTASGGYSHAEGYETIASGNYSHAEGGSTTASGDYSHAEGYQTIASGDYQTVIGKYNSTDTTSLFIIGNGTADNARSNLFSISSSATKINSSFTYLNKSYIADGVLSLQADNAGTHNSGIQLYNKNNYYITIRPSSAMGATTTQKTYYLPYYSNDMYGVFRSNEGSVGSTIRPVYVHSSGRLTLCSTMATATTAQEISGAKTFSAVTKFSNATAATRTVADDGAIAQTGAVVLSAGGLSVYENIYANKVYGSVWNDYAEYRQTHYKVRPGQCVYEKGDGSLAISYERMMPGANIVSDTFGFAIGETKKCKTPLAVSGRVLAYPYEPKEEYKAGDAVCSGPNGTISKMTRAEIRDYPERIVGTVSEIPTYEVWGSGNVKVNGRIWIKVR